MASGHCGISRRKLTLRGYMNERGRPSSAASIASDARSAAACGVRHDVLWTGCQWKALPKDLPPKSTVHDYLELWNWDGTLERIHHALYVAVREEEGREASPTVAIIDSQTAKGAQKGGLGLILRATTRARVRLEGACHLWRKVPSRELSIDLEADERFGWVTGRAEAS